MCNYEPAFFVGSSGCICITLFNFCRNLLSTISTKQDQAASKPASYGSVDYTNNFNEVMIFLLQQASVSFFTFIILFSFQIREGLNVVKRDMSIVSQRVNSQPVAAGQFQPGSCPEVSCVSATLFIGVTVLQIAAFLGYSMYRNSKENQAKKFY